MRNKIILQVDPDDGVVNAVTVMMCMHSRISGFTFSFHSLCSDEVKRTSKMQQKFLIFTLKCCGVNDGVITVGIWSISDCNKQF